MARQVPLISRFTAVFNFVGMKRGYQKLHFLGGGGDVNSKNVLFSELGAEQSAAPPCIPLTVFTATI
jgi:hypothetical protein